MPSALNSPFIPIAETFLVGKEKEYVMDCVQSGWISSIGKYVTQFETAFARYIGSKHASSCSNGTAALHLAYHACGIGKGDELIMPNLTFIATANAAAYLGGKPVFVDVDPRTWNMDTTQIEKKITPKTKAIVPVHLYGVSCDMKPIMELAQKYGLRVIEDCAESHGAEYRGKKTGNIGDIAAFSLYGNKVITTGEGGIITSNDSQLMERVQLLKNHGMRPEKRYWHEEVGYNYRMTALQAAFGLGQLEGIEDILQRRENIARYYEKNLSKIKGIRFQENTPQAKRIHWLINILVDEKEYGMNRDELAKKLEEKQIDSRRIFYPMTAMPIYKSAESFPHTEYISKSGLSIPSGTGLQKEQMDRVIAVIAENAQ